MSDADEPREKAGGIQCGMIPSELGCESGESEAMEGLEWDDLIDEHQKLAIEGEEPGRLVSGADMAPLGTVLRENWRVLVEEGIEVSFGHHARSRRTTRRSSRGSSRSLCRGGLTNAMRSGKR